MIFRLLYIRMKSHLMISYHRMVNHGKSINLQLIVPCLSLLKHIPYETIIIPAPFPVSYRKVPLLQPFHMKYTHNPY